MNRALNSLKNIRKKHLLFYILVTCCFISSILFVNNNYDFYEQPIAKVTEAKVAKTNEVVDMYDNKDQIFTQHLIAQLKNGEKKGQLVRLTNDYSTSKAYDQEYQIGDELFISLESTSKKGEQWTGSIKDVKRDKYVLMVSWIFIFILLLVGRKQGLFSIVSLAINATLLSYALDVYLKTASISLLVACSISAILFTAISLLMVNGFNEKTYAAIIATLLGTFASLLITYVVMLLTNEKGLQYEEMQFLTRPAQVVFMAGILIGSLGAVMDVAITMSSSIFGLYEKNKNISLKALKTSGMDIGKDIMGTMTNILFFVYISGSIPMLLLYLKNGSPLMFTLSMNLSLEMARALAGGIGIVLTIPIGVYTSIFFINRKRARS
ncbi:YibE/F family protein [Bacillus sp. CGMCC 1.16541]|uniref:YibE/F family protein n=1 Tax=Bacillus sp. CGMCC 1.16541 TaxID=2185143 RepID=UPI001EF72BF6|nr:YibE/F family protein [Bacillus sp. CGMCC 1.16541]